MQSNTTSPRIVNYLKTICRISDKRRQLHPHFSFTLKLSSVTLSTAYHPRNTVLDILLHLLMTSFLLHICQHFELSSFICLLFLQHFPPRFSVSNKSDVWSIQDIFLFFVVLVRFLPFPILPSHFLFCPCSLPCTLFCPKSPFKAFQILVFLTNCIDFATMKYHTETFATPSSVNSGCFLLRFRNNVSSYFICTAFNSPNFPNTLEQLDLFQHNSLALSSSLSIRITFFLLIFKLIRNLFVIVTMIVITTCSYFSVLGNNTTILCTYLMVYILPPPATNHLHSPGSFRAF